MPYQEVIVQNFRAKQDTRMRDHPSPPLEELLWTTAAARLVFGPHMAIQAGKVSTSLTAIGASETARGGRLTYDHLPTSQCLFIVDPTSVESLFSMTLLSGSAQPHAGVG